MKSTKAYEGFSGKIYRCPLGQRTIGYGFNLSDPWIVALIPAEVLVGDRPLSQGEADKIYVSVYNRAIADAMGYIGPDKFICFPKIVQEALTDMAYNLGRTKLNKFIRLKSAILTGDYKQAAKEIENSLWYKQVGQRAKDMADIMREESLNREEKV